MMTRLVGGFLTASALAVLISPLFVRHACGDDSWWCLILHLCWCEWYP